MTGYEKGQQGTKKRSDIQEKPDYRQIINLLMLGNDGFGIHEESNRY